MYFVIELVSPDRSIGQAKQQDMNVCISQTLLTDRKNVKEKYH